MVLVVPRVSAHRVVAVLLLNGPSLFIIPRITEGGTQWNVAQQTPFRLLDLIALATSTLYAIQIRPLADNVHVVAVAAVTGKVQIVLVIGVLGPLFDILWGDTATLVEAAAEDAHKTHFSAFRTTRQEVWILLTTKVVVVACLAHDHVCGDYFHV